MSVYEQTEGVSFEVIVIDNASGDGSAEMVKREFPKVILIENRENKGFAAANNQGIAVAKGRYVLLLNSDVVVLDKAITKTVSFADAHPEAAVVGCRVLNSDKTLQPTCSMFQSILNMVLSCSYLYKIFPRNRFFGRQKMGWWERNDIRQVDIVTGCFMLVRHEAIGQVGTMDERFFMYGEESDWCYRFKKAGWKVLFAPVGEIIHLGGQSSRQNSVQMLVQLRLSILEFMKKHHSWLTFHIARFLTVLFLIVRVPAWLCIALFCPKKVKRSVIMIHAYLIGIVKVLLFC